MTKRIRILLSTTISILLLSCTLTLLPHQKVDAATRVWIGGTSNPITFTQDMSEPANWQGGIAPVPNVGDILDFSGTPFAFANNDFTAGSSFAEIRLHEDFTYNGSNTAKQVSIRGNALVITTRIAVTGTIDIYDTPTSVGTGPSLSFIDIDLTLGGNVAIEVTADAGLVIIDSPSAPVASLNLGSNNLTFDIAAGQSTSSIDMPITGSGNIIKNGQGALAFNKANTFTGPVTVNAGLMSTSDQTGLGTATAGTTVINGATLAFINLVDDGDQQATIAEPLTLGGSGFNGLPYSQWIDGSFPTLAVGACTPWIGGCFNYSVTNVVFSGAITLTSNVTVGGYETTTLTGPLNGNFTVDMTDGYSTVLYPANLVINSSPNTSLTPNGTQLSGGRAATYDRNTSAANDFSMNKDSTAVISADIPNTSFTLNSGSTLKGSGITGPLTFLAGSRYTPGLSPGCITNSGMTLANGSTFEQEIGGLTACTQYDQTTVNGAVNLGGATLSTVLVNGFKPSLNNSFTMISNDGTDAVVNTFAGLTEGSTFATGGYTFRISYAGGSNNNDVVLTVTGIPAIAPNTGYTLDQVNPLWILLGTAVISIVVSPRSKLLGVRILRKK